MQTLTTLPRLLFATLLLGAVVRAGAVNAAPAADASATATEESSTVNATPVADANAIGPEASSVESLRCIRLPQLRDVKILDRQHIVFEVNNHLVYLNTLPRPCPGLMPNKAILYKPTLNQLCNVDVITVLEPIGDGFSQGASCGLGKFEPMSKADGPVALGKKPRGPRY